MSFSEQKKKSDPECTYFEASSSTGSVELKWPDSSRAHLGALQHALLAPQLPVTAHQVVSHFYHLRVPSSLEKYL